MSSDAKKDADKPTTRKTIWRRLWEGWIKPIAPAIIVLLTLRSAVADWNVVPSRSMEPTLLVGDRIFVNKLAYGLRFPFTDYWLAHWGQPDRGEITVLLSPEDGTRLVKRVIGLPGDVLEARNNRLFINGEPTSYGEIDPEMLVGIEDDQLNRHIFASENLDGRKHGIMITPHVRSPRTFGPITIPEDHYFVMGDNRDASKDSRWFGLVERDLLVGRSSRVVMSIDYDDYYLPRGDRFFKELP